MPGSHSAGGGRATDASRSGCAHRFRGGQCPPDPARRPSGFLRGRRWTGRLLLAVALVCGPVAAQAQTPAPQAVPADAAAEPQSVKQLLGRLHDANPDVARQAEDELRRLGATQQELDLGRRLYHPDARQRVALAQSLPGIAPRTRNQLAYELSQDASHEVRIAAVEAMRAIEPDDSLRARVGEMAASDPNSLVRGYARLLAAEWDGRRRSPRQPPESPPPTTWNAPAGRDRLQPVGTAAAGYDDQPAATGPAWVRGSGPDTHFLQGLRPVRPYWLPGDSTAPHAVEPFVPVAPAPAEGAPPLWPAEAGHDEHGDPLFAPRSRGLLGTPDVARSAIQPGILDRSIEPPLIEDDLPLLELPEALLLTGREAPLGFAGPSGVLPTEGQQDSHFVPVEDRWRIGFPAWDRYGKGHPPVDDYPYVEGHWWDPYNQNVLKGDYPIIGQHTFLNITATSLMLNEYREVPTATTPFESTVDPFQEEFFGDPRQYFYTHFFITRFELFHGNAAFKPFDWLVRVTPVFNMNYLDVEELGVVNADVRKGTTRFRQDWALQEYFVEAKLADLSPDYDFASVRVGSQPFTSDFRGFIFSDINRAIRLFGTRFSNRDQFNIIWFDQLEKDTNSELNTFDDRHQNTLIANYFRQDFIIPGYTAQLSFHYNRDKPSFKFDNNQFLVRPDPAGVFRPHQVEAYYFGIAGDGHIRRINISNAFYLVRGRDSLNPLAGRPVDIKAHMAAVELSYDRDWIRFRVSYFFASGDDDIHDNRARGFDSIFDNPNFAGGEFSFWQRQAIRLFGVNLVQRQSIVPDMRSSKIQGQSNFVNPGLSLVNAGMDFEITPKLRVITNVNHLWFDSTDVLEQFVFQDRIRPEIGWDLSVGAEYRPFHNDNAILIGGLAALIPGDGMDDLFGITAPFVKEEVPRARMPTMYQAFLEMVLTY